MVMLEMTSKQPPLEPALLVPKGAPQAIREKNNQLSHPAISSCITKLTVQQYIPSGASRPLFNQLS